MKHLQLFEKFIISKPDTAEAYGRLTNVGPMVAMAGLTMMYNWFYGNMMGDNDEMKEVVKTFEEIGEVYHDKIKNKPMYRAVHIHLPEEGMSKEDIMKITKAQTGPKRLQSWATTQSGAEWFFKHFVKEQNQTHAPHRKAAWIIVETNVNNLEQLITFEGCLTFFADMDAIDLTPHAEAMIERLDDDEMLKLHELIAFAPKEVELKVVKVLVPPIKDK